MKLISMTDFVLELWDDKLMSEIGLLAVNYAQFLKTPLKLEMFVTCDDNGNILKLPDVCICADECSLCKKYKQAKQKVLFEGFKPYDDYECVKYEDVYVDEEVCDGKFTVEDLIKDAGKTKIKLSQTALNAIFG